MFDLVGYLCVGCIGLSLVSFDFGFYYSFELAGVVFVVWFV